jgi:uncharacterized membrane protein YgdD (TMEM256/DUF423 family)
MMSKLYVFLGSMTACLAVAMGAFGAHGLKDRLSSEMLVVYQTGVHYHMIHSIGLILVGIIANWMSKSALLSWSGRLLLVGIVFFSGSLYVLSLTGIRTFGAITPFGGVSFLAGWVLLAIASLRGT